MGANIAGIYGAQIFRQDDAPRYRRGFSINIGILTFALAMAAVRFTDDRIRRRRGENVNKALEVTESQGDEESDESRSRSVSPSRQEKVRV